MGAMPVGGEVADEGTEVEVVTAGVILARIFRYHWHLYKRVCLSAGPSVVPCFFISEIMLFLAVKSFLLDHKYVFGKDLSVLPFVRPSDCLDKK